MPAETATLLPSVFVTIALYTVILFFAALFCTHDSQGVSCAVQIVSHLRQVVIVVCINRIYLT